MNTTYTTANKTKLHKVVAELNGYGYTTALLPNDDGTWTLTTTASPEALAHTLKLWGITK